MTQSPRYFILIGSVLLMFVVTTTLKVVSNAYEEFHQAEHYLQNQDPERALEHFERAIHWYVPGLSLREQAAQNMWAIATAYEAAGDTERALSAYRVLRSTFYAVRSFYTPGRDWIARCNERIAHLMASKTANDTADAGKSFEERKAELLALLSAEKSPYVLWAVVAELGFWGWVVCAFLFIWNSFTQSGALKPRPALFWAGSFILCYSLWVLGLYNV